jgi:polysaccharide biosynthesis/export protein
MKTHIKILGILAAMSIVLAARASAAQTLASAKLPDGTQPAAMDKATSATPDETGETIHKRNWRYTIHPSDTLDITFMITPEFNQTLTVQPDGFVTLRDVGDLKAAGKTLPELTEAIKTAYSKTLHDPVISIDLKDFEKPYFVVGGQVGKPGKFDWRGDVTLTQAIAIAGGFNDSAKHSQVLLFRRVSDQWTQARIINLKKMLESRDLQEDPELQPGDMLFVPKSALAKIKPFLPTTGMGAYMTPGAF